MYFYTIAISKNYRDTNTVKILMKEFAKWLDEERKNGKIIKSCISEAVSQDGIKSLSKMGMKPQDVDYEGLGIYYSPDCLNSYIKKMCLEELSTNVID